MIISSLPVTALISGKELGCSDSGIKGGTVGVGRLIISETLADCCNWSPKILPGADRPRERMAIGLARLEVGANRCHRG